METSQQPLTYHNRSHADNTGRLENNSERKSIFPNVDSDIFMYALQYLSINALPVEEEK